MNQSSFSVAAGSSPRRDEMNSQEPVRILGSAYTCQVLKVRICPFNSTIVSSPSRLGSVGQRVQSFSRHIPAYSASQSTATEKTGEDLRRAVAEIPPACWGLLCSLRKVDLIYVVDPCGRLDPAPRLATATYPTGCATIDQFSDMSNKSPLRTPLTTWQ